MSCPCIHKYLVLDTFENPASRPPPITRAMAQKATESLRNRQPSMVWKSARGEYAIDDAAMHHWYQQRVSMGIWPPLGPQWDEDER